MSKIQVHRVSDYLHDEKTLRKIAGDFAALNKAVWSDITDDFYIWDTEKVLEQFRNYPYGSFFSSKDGKIVSTLTVMKMNANNYLQSPDKSWANITGNGTLNTHDPRGDSAFGVDLTGGSGNTIKMVKAVILIGLLGEGVRSVFLGSRIPLYHKYANMDVNDYVIARRKSGKPLDPELAYYKNFGFKVVGVIPDYMHDPKSLNYGVVIKYDNPFYWLTKVIPFIKYAMSALGTRFLLSRQPVYP